MDFEGMKLADKLLHWILNITGVLTLIVGFSTESVYNMWYAFFGGVIVCCLTVVPPWPMYQKNPLSWQASQATEKKNK